jgi:hypothetical protein
MSTVNDKQKLKAMQKAAKATRERERYQAASDEAHAAMLDRKSNNRKTTILGMNDEELPQLRANEAEQARRTRERKKARQYTSNSTQLLVVEWRLQFKRQFCQVVRN